MRNVLGVGGKRAPGKGCVDRMKTTVCALASGACGAERPEGQAGGHSICELPWSSRAAHGPVADAEPGDRDPALEKSEGLQEMERLSLVRLVRRQRLSEARWDSYQRRCACWVLSV